MCAIQDIGRDVDLARWPRRSYHWWEWHDATHHGSGHRKSRSGKWVSKHLNDNQRDRVHRSKIALFWRGTSHSGIDKGPNIDGQRLRNSLNRGPKDLPRPWNFFDTSCRGMGRGLHHRVNPPRAVAAPSCGPALGNLSSCVTHDNFTELFSSGFWQSWKLAILSDCD